MMKKIKIIKIKKIIIIICDNDMIILAKEKAHDKQLSESNKIFDI